MRSLQMSLGYFRSLYSIFPIPTRGTFTSKTDSKPHNEQTKSIRCADLLMSSHHCTFHDSRESRYRSLARVLLATRTLEMDRHSRQNVHLHRDSWVISRATRDERERENNYFILTRTRRNKYSSRRNKKKDILRTKYSILRVVNTLLMIEDTKDGGWRQEVHEVSWRGQFYFRQTVLFSTVIKVHRGARTTRPNHTSKTDPDEESARRPTL